MSMPAVVIAEAQCLPVAVAHVVLLELAWSAVLEHLETEAAGWVATARRPIPCVAMMSALLSLVCC